MREIAETRIKNDFAKVNSKNRNVLRNTMNANNNIAKQKEYLIRKIDCDICYFRVQRPIDGENFD